MENSVKPTTSKSPSRRGRWFGLLAVLVLVLAGGGFGLSTYFSGKEAARVEARERQDARLARLRSISALILEQGGNLTRPRDVEMQWRHGFGEQVAQDPSFEKWLDFMVPYAREIASREVEHWEELMARASALPGILDDLDDPDEAIQQLASDVEWNGADAPLFIYIPRDELMAWLREHAPLSEWTWFQVEEFIEGGSRVLERNFVAALARRLELENELAREAEQLAVILRQIREVFDRFDDEKKLEQTLAEFDRRMDEQTGAAERARQEEIGIALQESMATRTFPVSSYRREGALMVFGDGQSQGVRHSDTGREILAGRYEIWQIMGPIILGRDPAQKRIKVWNQLGQEIAGSRAGVDVSFGADLEDLFVYQNSGLDQRRYLYVPERGCIIRLAEVNERDGRIESGVFPIRYLVTDEAGMPVSEGQGFWRFES